MAVFSVSRITRTLRQLRGRRSVVAQFSWASASRALFPTMLISAMLCAAAGCSSTTTAQLTRCQNEKKQLLTRVVDEQKRAETLQAELRNVNVRLAEAEKQLARVYDTRGGRFANSGNGNGGSGGIGGTNSSSTPFSSSSPFSSAGGSSGAAQGSTAALGPAGTRFSQPATVAPFVTSGNSSPSNLNSPQSGFSNSQPGISQPGSSSSGFSQPNRPSAPRELRPQSGRMLDGAGSGNSVGNGNSVDMAAPRNGRTESGWMPKNE